MLHFDSLLFEILNLHLVEFHQLSLRFFGFLDRHVLLSEDLLFSLLDQRIKVLLISLIGETGVVLATITLARQRVRRVSLRSDKLPSSYPIERIARVNDSASPNNCCASAGCLPCLSVGDRSGFSWYLKSKRKLRFAKLAEAI